MMFKKHRGAAPRRQKRVVIARAKHNISRRRLSDGALKTLSRLDDAGFAGYLVGGSVRDLLLGREPKDYDVVTDATPEQVRDLFRNSRLIGRRFRLAHVRYGHEIIEVSTFRAAHHVADGEGHIVGGRIVRDNVYGTMDDDVWRRDFTVNALFYNIIDETVVDYVAGMRDISDGLIRLIGDPQRRFVEDPVRLLRAVRFAAKLGFEISPDTERQLPALASLLGDIAPARLFEEYLKLFFGGYGLRAFEQLREYGLFSELFPQTEAALSGQHGQSSHALVVNALRSTDLRLSENKPVTPGFLLAALLWEPMGQLARDYISEGRNEVEAVTLAGDMVISRQIKRTAIPRRFTGMARDIWQLQPRLTRQPQRRPRRLLAHPRFRAAYDLLLLRAEAGEDVRSAADWWTDFQQANPVRPARAGLARKSFRRSGRRRST